jgi:hypothetical protein
VHIEGEGDDLAAAVRRWHLGGGDVGEDDELGPRGGRQAASHVHVSWRAAACCSNGGDSLLGQRRGGDIVSA